MLTKIEINPKCKIFFIKSLPNIFKIFDKKSFEETKNLFLDLISNPIEKESIICEGIEIISNYSQIFSFIDNL